MLDAKTHADICPKCGIAYSKWFAREHAQASAQKPNAEADVTAPNEAHLSQPIFAAFMAVPEQVAKEAFWARTLCWVLFAVWGGYFISAGIDWEKIGGSFMHNINLPFHEFGHVLFMPFGPFMTILGGSLFQVLMPLGLMLAFIFKQHDSFAGSIMLWWSGQSFIDLSPYIADAQYRVLPLVGGGGEESHDWGNLLTELNCLAATPFIAKTCFMMGAVLILIALAWGLALLRKQYRQSL